MNKVIWMVLVGLTVTVGSAQANCGHCDKLGTPKVSTEEMAAEKLDVMTKKLKLSVEQKAQVQIILKEKIEKMQQLMDQKHAAMQVLYEDYTAKLKGVLSEEQMKQWEAKKDCYDKKDKKYGEKVCPHDKAGKKRTCSHDKESGKGKKDCGHDKGEVAKQNFTF